MMILYTKKNCPECVKMKQTLNQRGIDYEEVNLDDNPEAIAMLKTLGYRSVPVILDQ